MYKVVTEDKKSLGLRKNPNVMSFPLNQWVEEQLPKIGNSDFGGIWCCEKLSSARSLKKYYESRYGDAKIFSCEIGNILYQNSYRTKTDRVKLIQEINE